MKESEADAQLKTSAMNIDDLAAVLSRAGGDSVTPGMIRADIASGAPTNDDGTISLVHYTAWAARRMIEEGKRVG